MMKLQTDFTSWLMETLLHRRHVVTPRTRKLDIGKENLKLGDIMYVTDDNAPQLHWPTGHVVYVYSGPDQNVGVVNIKTADGIY